MTVRANIDLKLLTIVDELYRTRSVSQTAENVGLNQSAISMSLARLRKHFNDPLFVRTNGGMEPTPHAAEIIKLIRWLRTLIADLLPKKQALNRDAFMRRPSTVTPISD